MKKCYKESTWRGISYTPSNEGICHVLRGKYLLKHVIEGQREGTTEVTGRRGRGHKQQLDELKGKERIL
jgi:hypothetical protein